MTNVFLGMPSGRVPGPPADISVGQLTGDRPFPAAARDALGDSRLRRNLAHATSTIRAKRALVVDEVPDWEELRDAAAKLSETGAGKYYGIAMPMSITYNTVQNFMSTYLGYGAHMLNDDGSCGFNTPEFKNALTVYTENGAWLAREEGFKGRLQPGMVADIAVFSRDLLTATPEQILNDTVCEMTVLGGAVVFERNAA